MKFRNYYLGLTPEEREDYAARCGTTTNYMSQLTNRTPFKIPLAELMHALANESQGALTLGDVLAHFYATPPRRNSALNRNSSAGRKERTGNNSQALETTV